MQALASKKPHHLRVFKVGVVGANSREFEIIARIFTATKYRNRCYQPEALNARDPSSFNRVDFVLMCTNDLKVILAWNSTIRKKRQPIPFVYLVRDYDPRFGNYQLKSPINPGKFVKLLDQYTIKEFNFLPEFEIGHESTKINTQTVSGLRLLHSANSSNERSMKARKKVLIADDSFAVRKQLQIEFRLLDAELDIADSAESAIEAIDKKTYDIIFLDVVMSGMSGYRACHRIKRSKTNRSTPVVMLTSRSSSIDKIKGTLSGCDAYLVKPVNHNEFESVYKKFVENP